MNTFDGSLPVLVSYDTIRDIEDRLNIPFDTDENNVLNGLTNFYSDYVQPNMFPIIVISILCIFCIIRYVLKQDRENREEQLKLNASKSKSNSNHNNHNLNISNEIDNINNKSNKSNKSNKFNDHSKKIKKKKKKKKKEKETETDEMEDIAEMISDEYLLTDTDQENDNNNKQIINPSIHPNSTADPLMREMMLGMATTTGKQAEIEAMLSGR